MITNISISNFKCFEQQDIPFEPLTVLTGLNGCGKSTVIQSLLLLRQSRLQGRLPSIGLSLNGELIRVGTAADALYEGAREDRISFSVTERGIAPNSYTFYYDRSAEVLTRVDHQEANDEAASVLFANDFQYLEAERIGPRAFFSAADFTVRKERELGKQGEFAAHFLHIFRELICDKLAVLHPDAKSNRLLDQVEAWLGEISPGARLTTILQSEMDLVSLGFSFETDAGVSNRYRTTNVGFGLTYVLPIIIACLILKPNGLLIVENPEVHLHPSAQSVVARMLALTATSGVQVIVETHSDHTVNSMRLSVKNHLIDATAVGILFFSRRLRQTSPTMTKLKMDGNGNVDSWPDGFFDEWEKSLLGLIDVE